MLDIKFIRENPEKVKKAAGSKGINIDTDEILEVDKKLQILRTAQQKLQEERNQAAKEKDIENLKSEPFKIIGDSCLYEITNRQL